MFENTIKGMKCGFCGKGGMQYHVESTLQDYSDPDSFSLEDIEKMVDGVLNEYLVYKCTNCGATEKYTFKDIEKMVRKEMSQRIIGLAAKKEIITSLLSKNKVLVHCGKCNGLDGKGSCLVKTYKNCKLKRLPNEL